MAARRYLIVNADDFGLSPGVNRGIIKAYEHGVVTSASLMVRGPAAAEAASYTRAHPNLSVGLHLDLGHWTHHDGQLVTLYQVVTLDDSSAVADEISRQLAAFRRLVGRDPTHIDSHQHIHLNEVVGPVLAQRANELAIPLRECNPDVRFCADFYGHGPKHVPIPGAISVERLIEIVAALPPGITDLMCHPGEGDDLDAMYSSERSEEVTTLCDPQVRAAVIAEGIELRSFHIPAGVSWSPSQYEIWKRNSERGQRNDRRPPRPSQISPQGEHMYPHRRQIVLGPRPYSPVAGWITTYVPRAGYLCHCPELPVASAEDADGQVWHLLGLAIQSEAGRPDPVDEITAATRDTIQNLYQTWEGRWVLIGAGELHMDASGLLGCFYTNVESSGGATEEELWVSSSAALLAEVSGADRTPVRNISFGEGFDYYTPPRSRFESIRRLLPSQILVLADGNVLPRRLVPERSESLAYDSILDRLREHLATVLRSASAAASGNLWLALSAGYDSRLLLAAARYADVPVKTYTQVHPGISQADLTLPPELARAVGFTHSFFSEGTFRKELAAMYDWHTAGHSHERERRYISHGQFDWCQRGDLLLRGGALAVGKAAFWRWFPKEESRSTLPDVGSIVRGFGYEGTTEDQPLISALTEWIGWTHRTPHPELDWRDRLYLEQRLGGWLSSVEQSLDLIDAVSLQPANSASYYSHVLQVPLEKRRIAQHHVDLIGSMAPELLAFPFSPFKGAGAKAPTAGELRRENKILARRNSRLKKRNSQLKKLKKLNSQLKKRNSQLKKRNSQLKKRNSRLSVRYSSRRYKLVDTLSEKVLQVPGVRKMLRRKPAR